MSGCTHPLPLRKPGPRIPRVYGSGPTEVCTCGAWRPAAQWLGDADWRPADTLAEAMEPDEGR